MITGPQLRAARALLGIDQRELARLAGLSPQTVQRMEACPGSVRAVVDSLGVEMIAEGTPSHGTGRGVRLIERRQAVRDER